MNDVGNIQWFPGHMTKTKRMIEADLKMVDAVVEITDARIPESSRNPILDELVKDKPRIMLMNKCDYADENATKLWKQYYEKKGIRVLTCDCRSGKGLNRFLPEVKLLLAELIERRQKRGMIGKALRLMVVGIPNVGKSSFINRMAKTKKTKVGDKPGVTRGKQWVSIDRDELLNARYKLKGDDDILCDIARSRGMLVSGGEPDTERAAAALLDEYRGGRIGRITLERPGK